MQASVWHDGHSTYGIRVGVANRDRHFDPAWKQIEVELDGYVHSFALTPGFWHKCPEFRERGQPLLRRWLQRHKSLTWPFGKPPRVTLIPLGNARFRLEA
jgi:hypothetical protein